MLAGVQAACAPAFALIGVAWTSAEAVTHAACALALDLIGAAWTPAGTVELPVCVPIDVKYPAWTPAEANSRRVQHVSVPCDMNDGPAWTSAA